MGRVSRPREHPSRPIRKHRCPARPVASHSHRRILSRLGAWAAAYLLSLTSLGLAAPASADVLVSNIDQSNNFTTGFGSWDIAQGFSTGSNAGGYTLTNVELQLGSSPVGVSVKVVTGSANGAELATLTAPATLVNGTNTFTAPANTTLSASTTYFLIIEGTSGTSTVTSSDNEDSGAAAGWSIGNSRFVRSASSTSNFSTTDINSSKFRINGANARANSPATGAPTISGFPQVGQTLTAATSGISDSDGLTGVSWSYQWIRVDGANETDISGATSSAYTLAAADQGKTVKVKVSFQDDDSNDEELTSTATGTVLAAAPACTTGNVWCATLTVAVSTNAKATGYCSSASGRCATAYGSLSGATITLGGSSYTVQSVRWGGGTSPGDNFHLTLGSALPAIDVARLTLNVDTHSLALSGATQENNRSNPLAGNYRWTSPPAAILGYEAGRQVRVELLQADPTITVAAGTSPVTEGTAATFTVTASPTPAADLTVNLTVADVEDSDFVAMGDEGDKTVTISANTATATYSVATVDDSTIEDNGDVKVTVAAGTGYSVGATSFATVTVNDNDAPVAPCAASTSDFWNEENDISVSSTSDSITVSATTQATSSTFHLCKTGSSAIHATHTVSSVDPMHTFTSLDASTQYWARVSNAAKGTSQWIAIGTGAGADTAPDFGTSTVMNQNYAANTSITDLVLPAATGGNGALSYALTPALPAGLSFSASTRTLSGTPTAGQAATTYTYKVTDADANMADSDADTLTFTIAVTYGCAGSTAVGGATVTSGGLVDDCEALLASEATLAGTSTALNWDTGTGMASWTGVALTADRVTELWLYHPVDDFGGLPQALAGSIPAQLGSLSSLTKLYLDGNSLTGTIPAALGNLSDLEHLYLNGNSLTGTIPAALGNLSDLQRLYLNGNSLSGTIPAVLGNLSNLQRLYLNGNSLTGSIPTALGNLSSLQELALAENQLDDPIPAALGNLSSLTHLWLYNNMLEGSIPSEFEKLANLQFLNLSNNSLTGCIPAGLRAPSGGIFYINSQKNSVNLPVCPGVPILMLTPGNGQIAASWTAPAAGILTDYDLEYKLSSATSWTDAGHTGTGTSATIDSLTNNSRYNVRVRANTATDTGAWSVTAMATPSAAPTATGPDFGTAAVADQSYALNAAITSLTLPMATGGNGTLTYALTPALPAGLTLDTATRRLSGTPTAGQAATHLYLVRDRRQRQRGLGHVQDRGGVRLRGFGGGERCDERRDRGRLPGAAGLESDAGGIGARRYSPPGTRACR